jgi:hypothetical protein
MEHFERVCRIEAEIVEQHIGEPPADHHAERRIDDEIVDIDRPRMLTAAPELVIGDEALAEPPGGDQPRHIGERIPAKRERPDLDQHRRDNGIRYGEERHRRPFGLADAPAAPEASSGRDIGAACGLARTGRLDPAMGSIDGTCRGEARARSIPS